MMKRTMRKIMAFVTAVVAFFGIAVMYYSELLPVYNGYNRIIRYIIYAVLAMIGVYNMVMLCTPSRKRKNVRRR